jgi:hypothetical protein
MPAPVPLDLPAQRSDGSPHAASILYKIEVNALGQITPDSVNGPLRGQYAFQTDILVEKRTAPAVPLVVI